MIDELKTLSAILRMIEARLGAASARVHEAAGYLEAAEPNAAIGSIFDLGTTLDELRALHATVLIIHAGERRSA